MYPSVGVCCGMHEERRRQGKCWRSWGCVNVSFTSPGWRIGGLMAGWTVVSWVVVAVLVGKMEWYGRKMQDAERKRSVQEEETTGGQRRWSANRCARRAPAILSLFHIPRILGMSFDCRRQALSVNEQTNALCTYHRTVTRRHVEPMADEQSLLTHARRHDTDIDAKGFV